jgi:hypothetical protein
MAAGEITSEHRKNGPAPALLEPDPNEVGADGANEGGTAACRADPAGRPSARHHVEEYPLR